MSKLHKDIPRMVRILKVIEQYNNFKQLGAAEDINYLKEKVNGLTNIKDMKELVKEFTWCAKMINSYYDIIDPEFKQIVLKEERDKELKEFGF